MSALGNVFDAVSQDGHKGRDLHYTVQINRALLGAPLTVQVPLELTIDGRLTPRAIGPGERGSSVSLNVPVDVPEGATLKLRGQGEEIDDGTPGDLFLTLAIIDPPGPQAPYGGWMVAGAVLFLGVLAWVFIK